VRLDPVNITDLITQAEWTTVEPPAQPIASNEP
jgi:hypothetical protein